MHNKVLKITIIFLVILLFIVYLLKFQHKVLGGFNIKANNLNLVESYESERSIHGDGVLVKHFRLNKRQFKNIEKHLEKFNPKEISLNKKEYDSYLSDQTLGDWSKRLMEIEQGVYYIIDRSPDHIRRVTNFDLIILDISNQSMYYIESDS